MEKLTNVCIGGWKNGCIWVDAIGSVCVDGRMNIRVHRRMNTCKNGWMEKEWIDRTMKGCKNECMNGQKNE